MTAYKIFVYEKFVDDNFLDEIFVDEKFVDKNGSYIIRLCWTKVFFLEIYQLNQFFDWPQNWLIILKWPNTKLTENIILLNSDDSDSATFWVSQFNLGQF